MDKEKILVVTRNAVEKKRLKEQNTELKQLVEKDYQIVGESRALRGAFAGAKDRPD